MTQESVLFQPSVVGSGTISFEYALTRPVHFGAIDDPGSKRRALAMVLPPAAQLYIRSHWPLKRAHVQVDIQQNDVALTASIPLTEMRYRKIAPEISKKWALPPLGNEILRINGAFAAESASYFANLPADALPNALVVLLQHEPQRSEYTHVFTYERVVVRRI